MKNKISFLLLPIIFLSFFLVSADTGIYFSDLGLTIPQGECFNINLPCNNCTYMNISISFPNGTTIVENEGMTNLSSSYFYNYTFCDTDILGYYSLITNYDENYDEDGLYLYSDTNFLQVTPNGLKPADTGQMSIGILYFFIMLSAIFIFLGYLFLRNDSLWIKYSGLFLMILGFGFIYYDLHLSNLYATTIAINSGAGNVTTGAFVMVSNFLKLAPYIVAGVIAFFSVKLFRASIKKKNDSDGWDDGNY